MPDTATIHTRPDQQFTLEHYDDSEGNEVQPDLTTLSDVDIERAPDAAVCGAGGCRETAKLLLGVIKGVGQRVLCCEHMADLVRREVLSDE